MRVLLGALCTFLLLLTCYEVAALNSIEASLAESLYGGWQLAVLRAGITLNGIVGFMMLFTGIVCEVE